MSIILLLLAACNPSSKQVNRALSDIPPKDHAKASIIVSDPDPDIDHYLRLSWLPNGNIEFKFTVRFAYHEDVSKPLIYDIEVTEIPTDAVTLYSGSLNTEELARLKEFLSYEHITHIEGYKGGRITGELRPLAYMHEIKGNFDPSVLSAQEFVDTTFRKVYLCDPPPSLYTIATLVEVASPNP